MSNSAESSMTVNTGNGVIDTPSNHSVDETAGKLKGPVPHICPPLADVGLF